MIAMAETRCNNCYQLFQSDDDLEQLEDDDGVFNGCPTCKTDEYLMDMYYTLDDLKKSLKDNNIQPEVYSGGVVVYRAPWGSDLVRVDGFTLKESWSNNARQVFLNPDAYATLTFCKGEVALLTTSTKESYDEEVDKQRVFYEVQGHGM